MLQKISYFFYYSVSVEKKEKPPGTDDILRINFLGSIHLLRLLLHLYIISPVWRIKITSLPITCIPRDYLSEVHSAFALFWSRFSRFLVVDWWLGPKITVKGKESYSIDTGFLCTITSVKYSLADHLGYRHLRSFLRLSRAHKIAKLER